MTKPETQTKQQTTSKKAKCTRTSARKKYKQDLSCTTGRILLCTSDAERDVSPVYFSVARGTDNIKKNAANTGLVFGWNVKRYNMINHITFETLYIIFRS